MFVERQFNTQIKAFHSNYGGEFQKINSYFKKIGIVHRLPCSFTYEQNDIAEPKTRHIVDIGLTLLRSCQCSFQIFDLCL